MVLVVVVKLIIDVNWSFHMFLDLQSNNHCSSNQVGKGKKTATKG